MSTNVPPSLTLPSGDDAAMQQALREADLTPHSADPKNLFLLRENNTGVSEQYSVSVSSPLVVHAAKVIQRWMRRVHCAQKLRTKLVAAQRKPQKTLHLHVQHVAKILSLCASPQGSKGFEYAQSLLFSDVWVRACGALLQLPVTHQPARIAPALAVRQVSSALLIALFPQDCLYVSLPQSSDGSLSPSPSPAAHAASAALRTKGEACERAATELRLSLQKLVTALDNILSALSASPAAYLSLDRLFDRLRRSLDVFLEVFKEWKTLDAQRMVKSLEDAISLAYVTQRTAQRQGDTTTAQSAQMQVGKFAAMLAQLIGEAQAQSRIEELFAAVEASLSSFVGDSVPAVSLPAAAATAAADSKTSPTERAASTASASPSSSASLSTAATQQEQAQERAMRHLDALAGIAGMENERLAHELTLDKHFRLPLQSNSSDEEESTTVTDAKSFASLLKKQMLSAMADKIINSLRRSNVDDLSQLAVDMVIPLRVASVPATAKLSLPCYSARILRIYSRSDPSASVSLSDSESLSDVALEVEYVLERSKENDVTLDRVRLSSEGNDAVPLVEALHDVCEALAALTPKRTDLQQVARSSFDPELLTLLLSRRSHSDGETVIDVQKELWPVLKRVFSVAISLQAEYRVQESEQWLRSCEIAFCGNESLSDTQNDNTRAAEKLTSLAQGRTVALSPPVKTPDRLESALPLIPLVLEKTMEIVEDIQRDTANYYIALLVPVLEKHGHEFLSRRFHKRLQERKTSLDRTAALLSQQLRAETLSSAVADLIEADYVPSGFTLNDLVLSERADGTNEQLTRGIVARAMLSLLQSPLSLTSPEGVLLVPETLQWDVQRLATLRTLVDKIALESSLTLSTRQILQYFRVASKESEETELQHRLDALLSTSSSSSVGAEAKNDKLSHDMSNIVAEIVQYVQFSIYRTRETTISLSAQSSTTAVTMPIENYDLKELQARVERMVVEVTSAQNPIFMLFSKRVYKVLLRAMLDKPFQFKLASFSLQSKGQERNLSRVIDLATKLFQHTMKVHGELYRGVLHSLALALLEQPNSSEAS